MTKSQGEGALWGFSSPLSDNACMQWHTGSCAETGELIEIPFGKLSHVGPKNILNGGQDGMNAFSAAKDDKLAMRPFAKLLWTFVSYLVLLFYCPVCRVFEFTFTSVF